MWFVNIVLGLLALGCLIALEFCVYVWGYDDACKEFEADFTCNCQDCYFFRFTEDTVNRYYESGVGDHEHYDPTKGLDKYMRMTDRTIEHFRDEVNKHDS